jgi:hypothetical protein
MKKRVIGGFVLKKCAVFTVFMILTGFLFAQTAEDLERILDTAEITYTQAAEFVLAAANLSSGGDAFTTARGKRWLPAEVEADGRIRLGELSLLIMKSFGIKGGIFYSLFSLPRYACRELVYARIIQGRSDPGGRLDGSTFLQILGRVLTYTGEDGAS